MRFAFGVIFWLVCISPILGVAGEQDVELREVADADCAEKMGRLVVLVNVSDAPLIAWVDRWFMEVQTPDHTKHALAPGEQHPLGCSSTRAGEQHWRVARVLARH